MSADCAHPGTINAETAMTETPSGARHLTSRSALVVDATVPVWAVVAFQSE